MFSVVRFCQNFADSDLIVFCLSKSDNKFRMKFMIPRRIPSDGMIRSDKISVHQSKSDPQFRGTFITTLRIPFVGLVENRFWQPDLSIVIVCWLICCWFDPQAVGCPVYSILSDLLWSRSAVNVQSELQQWTEISIERIICSVWSYFCEWYVISSGRWFSFV